MEGMKTHEDWRVFVVFGLRVGRLLCQIQNRSLSVQRFILLGTLMTA